MRKILAIGAALMSLSFGATQAQAQPHDNVGSTIATTLLREMLRANAGGASTATTVNTTTTATTPVAASGAPATAAEKAAILRAMQLTANARGLVMNECGDRVQPQYIPADVGLGRTILFVMTGGPNGGYTCYGDGPGLWLLQAQGATFKSIYDSRGGYMVIMPTKHRGANDIAFGGPGFTHSTVRWNGAAYVAGPDISDDAIGRGITLPAE